MNPDLPCNKQRDSETQEKKSERFWKKAVVVGSWYSNNISQEGRRKIIRISVKTAGNTVEQI